MKGAAQETRKGAAAPARVREPWFPASAFRGPRWRNRLLGLVNVLLIPYVVLRFPREAHRYVSDCGYVLLTGNAIRLRVSNSQARGDE